MIEGELIQIERMAFEGHVNFEDQAKLLIMVQELIEKMERVLVCLEVRDFREYMKPSKMFADFRRELGL